MLGPAFSHRATYQRDPSLIKMMRPLLLSWNALSPEDSTDSLPMSCNIFPLTPADSFFTFIPIGLPNRPSHEIYKYECFQVSAWTASSISWFIPAPSLKTQMDADGVKNQIFVLTLKHLMPSQFYFSGAMGPRI